MKKTKVTAIQRYILQSTPNREVNLRAFTLLGIDIGNKTINAKSRPHTLLPVLLFKIQWGAVSLSTYISMIVGIAFLT